MIKILEKIYSEKDNITNFSTFLGSSFCLISYLFSKNFEISIIIAVIIFSFSKVTLNIVCNIFHRKKLEYEMFNSFSETELNAIREFISQGTTTIYFSNVTSNNLMDGFRSLIYRNKAEKIIIPSQDPDSGPHGINITKEIYEFFLNQNNKKKFN